MANNPTEILDGEEQALEADLMRNQNAIKHGAKITLNWAQGDWFRASYLGYREILASGGMRSGKSLAMACKMYEYLVVPGTTIALCGRNYSDLRKSTLRLLLYGEWLKDGTWRAPIIPPQAIKSRDYIGGFITLWNGSTIILLGVADETKIRSITVAACFVEELDRISESAYTEISMRPSQYHPLGNVTYAACNPLYKGHWIYKHFVGERNSLRRMHFFPTSANAKNLPDGYIESKEGLSEDAKKRFLLGEWLDTNNGVFNRFDAARHVVECRSSFDSDHMQEIVVGQDLGGGSAYAGFVIAGRSNDGKIYIGEEWNKKAITHREMLKWMENFRELTRGVCVYDSANAVAKNELENANWRCVPSIKNIDASVDLMNDLFADDRLYIDTSCRVLTQEIEEAYRNPETNRVNKTKNWDCIDAARYAIWHLADATRERKTEDDFFAIF